MRRRGARAALGAAVACLLSAAILGPGPAGGAATVDPGLRAPARRILVISVPTLAYTNLNHHPLPNLTRLVDASTIADLTVHGATGGTNLADAYVTIGAGTRAEGGGVLDGSAFNTDEMVNGMPASEVYRQRTGRVPAPGLVHLGIESIIRENAAQPYDAEVGALGTELRDHGWSRAVIANADTVDATSGDPAYRREAVSALMDQEGFVPGGDVSEDLLQRDPTAPYGLRLDPAVVERRFTEVWRDQSVVLVEASDLVRAAASYPDTTPEQRPNVRVAALTWTDELVGRLLAHVDLARDAVVLVAPARPPGSGGTTVTGVRARFDDEWPPGLVTSSTTRRSGFVQLIDVAPTILTLAAIERPPSMEGRTYQFATVGGTAAERREYLATANAESKFRDEMLVPVHTTFLVLLAIALVAMAGTFLPWSIPGNRALARVAAYAVLMFFPAVLAASPFDFTGSGAVAYWVYIAGVAAALIMALEIVGRALGRFDALLAALAVVVLVIGVDVMTGSHLQWISTLGYSPTRAGRFTGMGNLCYSAFSVAGLLLGVLLLDRFGRRAFRYTVALYVGLVVVDGLPLWGADVGGVLSMVPALGITGWLLAGRTFRLRAIALTSAIAIGVVAVLTGLDLLRPSDSRTHLGRLAETAAHEGWSGVWTIIDRKAQINLESWGTSLMRWAIPLVIVFAAWLWWRHRARIRQLTVDHPPLLAGTIGLAVLMVLGYALNDSGVAIPGVMLGISGAVLVALLLDPEPVGPDAARASATPTGHDGDGDNTGPGLTDGSDDGLGPGDGRQLAGVDA